MTEIATIDWFGRWGTSVFFENTAIFYFFLDQLANVYSVPATLTRQWRLAPFTNFQGRNWLQIL